MRDNTTRGTTAQRGESYQRTQHKTQHNNITRTRGDALWQFRSRDIPHPGRGELGIELRVREKDFDCTGGEVAPVDCQVGVFVEG